MPSLSADASGGIHSSLVDYFGDLFLQPSPPQQRRDPPHHLIEDFYADDNPPADVFRKTSGIDIVCCCQLHDGEHLLYFVPSERNVQPMIPTIRARRPEVDVVSLLMSLQTKLICCGIGPPYLSVLAVYLE